MTETLTISVAASADDGRYFNSSASITAQWMQIGSHTNEAIGPWTGFRFQINSTLAAIDTADITDVRVQLRSNVAGTFSGYWRVEQTSAAAFATSGSNRADNRYNAIGSTGQVLQGSTSVGAASDFQSSDLSARVIDALDGGLAEGDYIGIVCGVDPSVAGNYYVDCASWDHVSAPAPQLVITYDPPTNDEAAPEGIDTTEVFGTPTMWQSWTGISYHDGVGNSTNRTLDVYTPTGPPPRLGWPTVVWAHGGAFAGGGRGDLGADIKKAATEAGYAIVSVDYKLTDWDLFLNTVTGWTHPYPVGDYLCALRWLTDHAGRYNLDPTRFVASGYSAGGHIALEAALLAEDTTPDDYEMVYQGWSTTQGRYADYPTMDVTQGRQVPRVRGFFGWGNPVSLTTTYTTTWAPDLLDAYWGARPSTTGVGSLVGGEGNIDSFLTAATGTVYEDRTPGPPSFPIGYAYDTTDIVVTTSAGYTALYNALDAVGGYSIGAASGVIDLDGLSRYSYAGIGHDYVVNVNTVAFFGDWLEALRDTMTDRGQLWPRPPVVHADAGQTWPRS